MGWRHQGRIVTPEEGQALLARKAAGVERPWSEIGYHRGFERVGPAMIVRQGRPIGEAGAHCRELHMNLRSIGYCVVGDFDAAPPDMETVKLVARQAREDCALYGIPVNAILGHREAGLMAGFDWRKGQFKSCPGKHFPMDTLRAMVAGVSPV
jgi:hypothetical protein